jgi:hypothetical protein
MIINNALRPVFWQRCQNVSAAILPVSAGAHRCRFVDQIHRSCLFLRHAIVMTLMSVHLRTRREPEGDDDESLGPIAEPDQVPTSAGFRPHAAMPDNGSGLTTAG